MDKMGGVVKTMIKNYILDTNILLQDPDSLFNFEDNCVIIPIGVVEELDKFKKDITELGRNARQASRSLDKFRSEGDLREGVPTGNQGVIKVRYNGNLEGFYKEQNIDLHVIHIAQETLKREPNVPCVIVSNDVNIRIRANALGLAAEQYEGSKITHDDLDVGYRDVIFPDEIFDVFASTKEYLVDDIPSLEDIPPNFYLVIKKESDPKKSFLGRVDPEQTTVRRLISPPSRFPLKARNKEQAFLIDALLDNDIKLVSIAGKAGTGKSQPLSEPVLTPYGFVPMGDLDQGDYVIGKDGRPTKITSIHPQGELEIYEVVFSDGSSTRCSLDHLWETKTVLERDNGRDAKVRTTEEIMETLTYGGNFKKNHTIPMVDPVEMVEKPVGIDPYLMGVLIGDGHFGGNVHFSTSDDQIKDSFEALLNEDDVIYKCGTCDYRIKRKYRNNCISSTKSFIIKYGLDGLRSYEKYIPDIYKNNSLNVRISVFQGLMDSDGTIDYRTGKDLTFSTTSENLAFDFEFLVNSFGGTSSISCKNKWYTYKGERLKGRKCYNVHIVLPNCIFPFRLKRKLSCYVPNEKYTPTRYITDVIPCGTEQCQCIKVEAKDDLYVTNGFIVTHNTLLAIACGYHLVENDKHYKRLLVSRPVFPMGRDIGFLPGDIDEKLDPWMQPIYDAFDVINCDKQNQFSGRQIVKDSTNIVVEPLTYIRGRSIHDQFLIIDESQNLTALEIKTIITRAGENTKVVLTGDIYQIDNPYIDSLSNGLSLVSLAFNGSKLATSIVLDKGVRSPLAEEASNKL